MFKRFIIIGLSVLLSVNAFGCFPTLSASANDSTAPQPEDPLVLANTVIEEVKGMEHPYMFYSSDEEDALREKINTGNSKKAFDIVKTTASGLLNRSVPVSSSSNGTIGRQLQYFVAYLSLYGMLAEDEAYSKKAVQVAVTAARAGNVDMYFKINDALCVGDFGHAYALAYDMLYEYMTDDERAIIKAEMEEIGEWLYTNSPEINTWGADTANRKAWNWNAVAHGALGLIAISLGDHQEWLELAINRTQGYYEFAVDSTGAAMEGLHYVGYALNSLAPLDFAIYRASEVELMDAYPGIQAMPYWSMLYMTTPQGKEQVTINQSDGLGNYSSPFYIINRYGQADALWGWEHTYGLEGDGKFATEYQGNGWSAPAIILFEDQSLTPEKPTAENNPLLATFEKGLVSVRDSWENDAAMMTFTCGYGQPGCWNHPDDNSFTFYAGGESFVIDCGSSNKESSGHNVVIVDGIGMDYSGGPTMREGYLKENKVLENGNLYLLGDNSTSYSKQNIKASVRQIVFGDGEVPFVLVYDYFRKDSSSHKYNINFYTKNSNTITISDDGSYATITGANNGAICYVIPYSADGAVTFASTGNALTTETQATMLRQATLFIMANPDGSMPEVDFAVDGKEVTVNISRMHNWQEITETYVFDVDELADFGTTEIIEQETESTSPAETETETDSKPVDTETETKGETDAETEQKDNETESNAQTDDNTQSSGGCGSAISASVIPVAAVGAIAFALKKKKRK